MTSDLAGEPDIVELIEYASVRAEEAAVPWQRARAGWGKGPYGGAILIISFSDRKLLNAMKRAGVVEKGVYSGEWLVEHRWSHIGQEAGLAIAMADAACDALNAAFGKRATAWVHHYWS